MIFQAPLSVMVTEWMIGLLYKSQVGTDSPRALCAETDFYDSRMFGFRGFFTLISNMLTSSGAHHEVQSAPSV